ncbi:hypothetical protein [Myxococcus virescens]|uniref:Site-specific DNA-methyltransferase (adenine-specific) n=1 Tax=Myxococcus virescens TaxID=83456 RepID=A0A511H573_9BACT|nr:hypothetical protein [Myxococcus virescens]GEL68670.1 hypothetical protein MVI01_04540 [Myxococcus virescens]SDE49803.1 hypothetical protein SAMN04488504_107297 [Myxococcus virescens]
MAFAPRGIKNVGEFYSQHYLDELLEKDLKGLLQHFGEEGPQKALKALRRKYEQLRRADKDERDKLTQSFHQELLTVLGYPVDGGEHLVELEPDLLARVLLDLSADGNRRVVAVAASLLEPEQGLLEARPLSPTSVRHTEGETSFQDDLEELISTLFTLEEPPRWVLALAGREVLLAERSRWGQGRYLLFDLDAVLGGGDALELTATAALLCREAVAPEQGTPAHDLLDEGSHRHAYGVSEDLKYNLREAVELLGNAWVQSQRESKKKVYAGDGTSLFDDALARSLTNECLTFLYRLLFIFYAEARGEELGVLPMNSESYRLGYSLEHLRDLELVPLHGAEARVGTFIHESIEQLFALLHRGQRFAQGDALRNQKFTFEVPALDSALFDPRHTPRLSSARLPNEVMQQVLQLLSLSRQGAWGRGRNRGRGRISYARLGINQLGAVYEGLLSYTGFFAREDLYELKKEGTSDDGDALEQVFFARASEVERFKEEEFVQVPDPLEPERRTQRKVYKKGSFVYRLAGRDRERSASYYTPEVLTRCVVKYALQELLTGKSADEILRLTLCEPAMGSGAFLNEGINQLASAYLERKQAELGRRIPQAEYAQERQRVKAWLATHNAYGVDLNPVAVDLAKVSLWLNILGPGIPVPWFDLRLGVGNSLVGCRRQVFRARDVLRKNTKTAPNFLVLVPETVPLSQPLPEDGILHFLLPDEGMGAVADDKVAKSLAQEEVKLLKEWRKRFISAAWKEEEVQRLHALSAAADRLWMRHVEDRRRALARTAQTVLVWGQPVETATQHLPAEERERIVAEDLGQPGTPGRRLQLAMDAWCALWSWPLDKVYLIPERDEWLSALEALLVPEGAVNVAALKQAHPWLAEVGGGFFHWELAFAEVFADRGGFDLLLGNPPWVKLEWKEAGILSEFDATLGVREHSASDLEGMRKALLNSAQRKSDYLGELTATSSLQSLLSAKQAYPLLGSGSVNLYKNFICLGWRLSSAGAVLGLIHQPSLFDDPKGGALRAESYRRLRLVAFFRNALLLFPDVDNNRPYCLTVWFQIHEKPQFKSIGNLFHPRTIDDSLMHLGAGPVPGIKNESDAWEIRGHRHRVIAVDEQTLELFAKLYDEPGTPSREARLPIVHSIEMLQVLRQFAAAPKLADLDDCWFATMMWNETNQQKDGTISAREHDCSAPEEWILSGPHFYVARPFNKTPNPRCRSNKDYTQIDLTRIPDDYLPRTNYSPGCSPKEYRARTPTFKDRPVTDFYRHVQRKMLAMAGERTVIGAIIPPGTGHIDGCVSFAFTRTDDLVRFSAICSSLLLDYLVRSTGAANIRGDGMARMPFVSLANLNAALAIRTLRLNCLTSHYASLWEAAWTPEMKRDGFTRADARLSDWSFLSNTWERPSALRTDFERRQALVEIDALVALMAGLSADDLCLVYRVQFPVLYGYERDNRYDRTGRLVSSAALRFVAKQGITEGTVTAPDDPSITYVLPFDGCDREADMRQAYAEFQRRHHAQAASEVA